MNFFHRFNNLWGAINILSTRFSGQHTTGSSGIEAGSGIAAYKYSKGRCRRSVFLPFDAKNWQERKAGQDSESGGERKEGGCLKSVTLMLKVSVIIYSGVLLTTHSR